MAADGTVTAVWSVGTSPGPYAVKAASRAPGGSWSDAATVATGSTFFPLPEVAVDPAGDATVVWRQFGGAVPVALQASTKAAGAASWPPGEQLDIPATATHDVAAGPDGTFVAVWSAVAGGVVVRARVRAPGGGWAPSTTLTSPGAGDATQAAIAASAGGRFTVVWEVSTGPNTYVVQSAGRGLNGFWSPAADVSSATLYEPVPTVAMDPAGSATALWRRYDGVSYVVRAAQKPVGSVWSPATDVSPAVQGVDVTSVGMDASGRARALWSVREGLYWVLHTASLSAAGTWDAEPSLSAATTNATGSDLAVDPAGNAVAIWQESSFSGPTVINALVLDGAGPTVTGFAAAPTGQVGASLSYAATATDTWSGIAGYTWSFGDGTTATGPSVAHTYTALGSHPVTLTVTDAVGNATTRTASHRTAVAAPLPAITTFKLKKKTIATDEKTKLKVRLTTASTLKLVIKSKHKHLVKGKKKYVKIVIRKHLPAGLSKITIKAKLKGKTLKSDTYVLTGTATNSSGTSPKKKTKLKVVR